LNSGFAGIPANGQGRQLARIQKLHPSSGAATYFNFQFSAFGNESQFSAFQFFSVQRSCRPWSVVISAPFAAFRGK
jgi:hypothetical protein